MPRGGVLTYGFEEFANSGSTAVIQKVALARPRGLRMLRAWIVPITGRDLYGVVAGYPPRPALARAEPGVQWSRRQRASGARIPHSQDHDVNNIVLLLKPTHRSGTANGVDVYYSVAGQQYLLQTGTQIVVKNGGSCPG